MKKIILLMTAVIFSLTSCKKEEQQTALESDKDLTSLEKLTTGNQRFLDEKSIHPHQNKKTVLDNQDGQKPFAVIITCSDSRVSPEIVFDQGLGDLFVIRNAGNLISDIDMGSIEYAVEHLNAKLIVVLGHTECGAIKAYVADKNGSYKKHLSHIDNIVETISQENEEIQAEKENPKEKNLLGCINANITHSAKLIEQNKIIKNFGVQIVSMRYDVHTGKVVKL
ncbi:carbonic anhydrase [Flavobacterium sp. MC2016-06]|jgi:carbonic anhydrase|uniref:carbonic anhydrase n=1 Tax=Flavobacterium sp. MC2016-06 TaxID=2676308 RepID=UPI0012BB181F|nr:carbonic anhydrase [Flavobacterium sp. MC2016-06]MBU3858328.1 carbonic anhydrase [Flavobacterium sp. MC2016-06]